MASFNKHSYLSPAPKNHTLCMRSMASLSFANENRDPSRVLTSHAKFNVYANGMALIIHLSLVFTSVGPKAEGLRP